MALQTRARWAAQILLENQENRRRRAAPLAFSGRTPHFPRGVWTTLEGGAGGCWGGVAEPPGGDCRPGADRPQPGARAPIQSRRTERPLRRRAHPPQRCACQPGVRSHRSVSPPGPCRAWWRAGPRGSWLISSVAPGASSVSSDR